MSFDSVGFIGLGAMGYPMAKNLAMRLHESARVFIFDISTEAVERLSSEIGTKVHPCQNAMDVAEKSTTILTMVPEGSHVRSVYLTPETGVLAANVRDKLLVDLSTIDVATSLAVRDQALNQSAAFYDAPVSGGTLGAEKATLTVMLGCAKDDQKLPVLHELLGFMAKPESIFACGGPSLGLTAKFCNNYCSGLITIATAEAMNIGIRSGMDPKLLARIFATSTAQSTICDKWNPVPGICPEAPASKRYHGGFKLELMRKDFSLAVETAKRVGAELALAEAGLAVYDGAAKDSRCRELDYRVVYRFLGGNEEVTNADGPDINN